MENKELRYDTPDLGLAGYLHCKGVKINDAVMMEIKQKAGKKIGSRFSFVFKNPDGICQKLELEYGNSGTVNAREYDNSIKFLRMLIKSKKYNTQDKADEAFKSRENK